jgi:hypothetical protein
LATAASFHNLLANGVLDAGAVTSLLAGGVGVTVEGWAGRATLEEERVE